MKTDNVINKLQLYLVIIALFYPSVGFNGEHDAFVLEAEKVQKEVQEAIISCGQHPEPIGTGITGALYLKNCEGEKIYVFKSFSKPPKSYPFLKTWTLSESVVNEVLAYLIDRFVFGDGSIGRYGVPPTYPITVTLENEVNLGSAQKYIPNTQTLENTDLSLISATEAVNLNFSLLTGNADMHNNNILWDTINKKLVLIDNGYILVGAQDLWKFSDNKSYYIKSTKENLPKNESEYLLKIDSDKSIARVKEQILFLNKTFPDYQLNSEKIFIFKCFLLLAKKVATENVTPFKWHYFQAKKFNDFIKPRIEKIDFKELWLQINNNFDWNKLVKDYDNALEEIKF